MQTKQFPGRNKENEKWIDGQKAQKVLHNSALYLYWTLEHLASAITGCILISAFASLLGISIEITSSAIELKNSSIVAEIKNYESIIKEREINICMKFI